MASSRVTFTRLSLFRQPSFSFLPSFYSSPSTLTPQPFRGITPCASLSTSEPESTSSVDCASLNNAKRWKPMCLYHLQGKCTKIDDPIHLGKFNHDCSSQLKLNASDCRYICSQQFDFFLVLDLEGKIEILEFPILVIDAKSMDVVDVFHRFVRPSEMSKQRIDEYIEGKYGKIGVDGVWHDTAIPFSEVIKQFESWMAQHHLWEKKLGGHLNRAAFVTCGNWDLKTKVPQQCKVSKTKLPPYFMEWINLKDAYLNFYKRRATGMITMMKELQIPLQGSHHLGIDDTVNIARVLQRMLTDGAVLQITARRNPNALENVKFLFKDRIR